VFVVKIFRGGTRSPEQIEFYSTDTPVVVDVDDVSITHQIEISYGNRADLVDVEKGDVVFIENSDGITIHSIR